MPGPGPGPAASRTVETLAAYLSSPTALRPDPAAPGAKLDGLVYWRVNRTPDSAAAYEAFRRSPGSADLRAAVVEYLTGAIAADEGFAAQLATAVAALPAPPAGPAGPAGPAAAEPVRTPVEATQPSEYPKWVAPADSPTMSAPVYPGAVPPPGFGPQGGFPAPPPGGPWPGTSQPGFPPPPGFGPPGQPWPPGTQPPRQQGISRRTWALIAVGAVLAVSVGVGIANATNSSNGDAGHYTYSVDPASSPDGSFELLDWTTDSNGTVTGTARSIDPTDPANADTVAFTGTQHDGNVTFIPVQSTGADDLTGTLANATLVVNAPQDAIGGAPSVTFRKTTVTAFDQAVQQYEAQHPNGQTT